MKNFHPKALDENTLIFKGDLDKKRGSALFLATLITFAVIFFEIILFHKKSHVLFPLIASTIVSYIGFSILWVGNGSIPKETYLNLMNIKQNFAGIKAIQFLGQYLAIFLLVLVFGNWYKLK